MFRCLSCGSPSPHYYHCLSTTSGKTNSHSNNKNNNQSQNIQLTECGACRSIVDNYMEREWLLVILDLVLLRQKAYRHVYWNRLKEQSFAVMGDAAHCNLLVSVFLIVATTAPNPVTALNGLGSLSTGLMIAIVLGLYACSGIFLFQCRSKFNAQLQLLQWPVWTMVHCAIWFPLVGVGLIGMTVSGIWNTSLSKSQYQDNFQTKIIQDIGLIALVAMWQVSGLRVALTLPA
ncbi:hypothetical protein ACA910_017747 [Epithemia clementina (nom. ined.)]